MQTSPNMRSHRVEQNLKIRLLLTKWLSTETTLSPALKSLTPDPTSTTSPATSVTAPTRKIVKLESQHKLLKTKQLISMRGLNKVSDDTDIN